MARIALLTSGGDAPGMNPAIRAVVTAAAGAGAEVVGVRRGFRGLHEKDAAALAPAAVEGITNFGGTVLRSSRFAEMKEPEAVSRCAENLKALGAEALIVVGGEGTVQGSLALSKAGARVVHVPSTIDNDVSGTDISLGVDTCLNTILRLVDSIRDTASSMERPIVIEVMGRLTGYLAIMAAVGSGARAAILPERPFPWDRLRESVSRGGQFPIIVCAEGAGSARQVVDQLKDMFPGSVPRVSVLGYIQRGGTPSFFDRLLGARLGEAAVEAALGGVGGRMIAWRSGNCIPVPLEEVAGRRRQVSPEVFETAKKMGILFE
jgi:6-phosphofructokinase 1